MEFRDNKCIQFIEATNDDIIINGRTTNSELIDKLIQIAQETEDNTKRHYSHYYLEDAKKYLSSSLVNQIEEYQANVILSSQEHYLISNSHTQVEPVKLSDVSSADYYKSVFPSAEEAAVFCFQKYYSTSDYDFFQERALEDALASGIDITMFKDPSYAAGQMNQIRVGLEHGIDASLYADATINWRQMATYRQALEKEDNQNMKKRLFVDMDGTLAYFKPVDQLEKLYEENFFRDLEPQESVVEAVRTIQNSHPEIEVYILSAVLSDSKYALKEKQEWLQEHLPEMPKDHQIFPPCGKDKKNYLPEGIHITDYLLDDYTNNLTLWQPPARGIKLLNDINDTHKSWSHDRVDYQDTPKELAENILKIMGTSKSISQEKTPSRFTKGREKSNSSPNREPDI